MNTDNSIILASIPDSRIALEKRRCSNREIINDKLFDLERQIAEKCKNFSKQITIEPLKTQRRLTQEFFGSSEPLTPVNQKPMSITPVFEIKIIDGNTTCETTRIQNDEREDRPSTFFNSAFSSGINLNHMNSNSVSPQSIREEKPILEINIQRYSNSLSQKQEFNSSDHSSQLKKLQEEEQKAKEEIKRIQEQIQALKTQPVITLSELTAKKKSKIQTDDLTPATAAKNQNGFSPRNIPSLPQNLRFNEQKVYVYQKIFTRIYNIINQNPIVQQEPGTVDEIRTRRYLKVQDDLRNMFQTIRTLNFDISKYSDIKKNMQKQIFTLDDKIKNLTKIIQDLQVKQQSLTNKKVFKCQFQINTCKDSTPTLQSQITDPKIKERIDQINKGYEDRIQQKYKEMIQIRMQQQNIINQALRSEHNQSSRKKVQVIRQITQKDEPIAQDMYVKRVYSRKIKTSRNVQILDCNHPQLHASTLKLDELIQGLITSKNQ